MLAGVFVASTIGFHFLGGYDWLESVWMVVITMSTVGFGEHSDAAPAIQGLTILVILFGVSSAAYTCGGFLQLLLEGEVEQAFGKRKMSKELNRLSRHVVICGFGRMGQDLAKQLQHRGIPMVVIDKDEEKIRVARELNYPAIQGDATQEGVLEETRLPAARALVSALSSDADNVFIALTGRNLCPKIQIIAKSEYESSCRKLRQAGADKIVMPYRVGAQQMERMISRPTTADLVELFAEASHLEMELDELKVSDTSSLAGQTLVGSRVKQTYNLLVVGIKDSEGELSFNPGPDEMINSGDTLLVIGQVKRINELKRALD